jgi:magnesium-transporting ATPase (P-type)
MTKSASESATPVAALAFPAHTADDSKVLEALGVNPNNGLSEDEAAARLETYGPNRIKPPPKANLGKIIFRQVANAMSVILSTF